MNNKENPCVFLDLSINGFPAETMIIELFGDEAPKTSENFRALCTGELVEGNTPLHYKGTEFGRIHNGVYAEGGYFSNQNGGESIDGGLFADEKINQRNSDYGVLAVFPSTKGFKFYIILDPWCNTPGGSRVVFGKVIEGMETVKKIDEMGTPEAKPSGQVKVTNCGQLSEEDKKKYVMESPDKGKKKKTWKKAKPSNYVSEFYSCKRKFSSPSESSDSDSGIYSSLRAKLKDGGKIPHNKKDIVMEPDKGKKEKIGKKAISSSSSDSFDGQVKKESFDGQVKKESFDGQVKKESFDGQVKKESFDGQVKKESSDGQVKKESFDGQVKKEKCELTVVDERQDWLSKFVELDSELEVDIMVILAKMYKIPEDMTKKTAESSKGEEKTVSSSMIPNYYLEFYHSRRKYWSADYSIQKKSVIESRKGKKKKTWNRPMDCRGIPDNMEFDAGKKRTNGKRVDFNYRREIAADEMEFFDEGKMIVTGKREEESDPECYHKKMYLKRYLDLYPKSSNSYSSD